MADCFPTALADERAKAPDVEITGPSSVVRGDAVTFQETVRGQAGIGWRCARAT